MRNKEYSMLIKYKTEPTIIVLSPNCANLIKILTQFVYSINIRYFSPPPLPCPVTLQGITNSMGERLLFNPLPLCFRREYRGSAHRARRLKARHKPTDEILFPAPPSLRDTSPIWLMPHPVRLRGTAMEEVNSELSSPKAGQAQPNRKRFSS